VRSVREEEKERSEFDDERNFSLTLSSLSLSNSLFLFADKPLLNRNLMFDFEKLVVFQRAKRSHKVVLGI
jgi:hypothetical protein